MHYKEEDEQDINCLKYVSQWLHVAHSESVGGSSKDQDYVMFPGWTQCLSTLIFLQDFDTVGWLSGRASVRPVKKIEWLGVGMVICLEQYANDLHMVIGPADVTATPSSLASLKSRLV